MLLYDVSKIIPVTHDELIFYANNNIIKAWDLTDENKLYHKLQGLNIYISNFFCKFIRWFQLSEKNCFTNNLLSNSEQFVHTKAYVIIYSGMNQDGWWINKDVIDQVKEQIILIFK